jgi:hypothetical protein
MAGARARIGNRCSCASSVVRAARVHLRWASDAGGNGADRPEDELSARDALLLWCKKKTKPYGNVNVTNFDKSWRNGLGFCALIHAHKPGLINYASLDEKNAVQNLELAFSVAEQLGIPRFLDAMDIAGPDAGEKPDEKSIIAYLTQFYKYFSQGSKGEVAARRIAQVAAFEKALSKMKDDYNVQAQEFVAWCQEKKAVLSDKETAEGGNTLEGVQAEIAKMKTYSAEEKPPKAATKLELDSLLNQIQIKIKAAKRAPFEPKPGCSGADINGLWDGLNAAEVDRNNTLQDELARQRKIADLYDRFNRKAKKLEEFHAAKDAYCDKVEDINSLPVAQTKVNHHESYETEYEKSLARVAEVKDLAAQIVALRAKVSDEVQARTNTIEGNWGTLKTKGERKRDKLASDYKREQDKDALRKRFATEAADHNNWLKKTAFGLHGTGFGNSLSQVRASKEGLDKEDAALTGEANTRVTSLEATDGELKAAGVVDNNYTSLEVSDIHRSRGNLQAAQQARIEAWQKELARQEAMESARINFAEKAKQFAEAVEQKQREVLALTGEPDAVVAALPDKPLVDELKVIEGLDADCKALGITSNEHTNLTVGLLRSNLQGLHTAIANMAAFMAEEKKKKADYHTRAEQLMAWIKANTESQKDLSGLDNTLVTARSFISEFNTWRVTEKAANVALKSDVATIFKGIERMLAESIYTRPAFHPTPSIADIDAAWEELSAAENTRDKTLAAELARQEQLAMLVRKFHSDAADLVGFITPQEEYFRVEEKIDSLTAAQVQLTTLQAADIDVNSRRTRRDDLQVLAEQIRALNYKDQAPIDQQAGEVTKRFDALTDASAAKRQHLEAALARESEKEKARLAYVKATTTCISATRNHCDTISDVFFGNSLSSVRAYEETLKASDAKILAECEALLNEVHATAEAQAKLDIKDNIHSNISVEDAANSVQAVKDELAKRQDAWKRELERQEAMEAHRLKFAAAAKAFADAVDAKTAEVLALTGTPDEVSAALPSNPLVDDLAAVEAIDTECRELKITSNEHTDLTISILRAKLKSLNIAIANMLRFMKEEKVRKGVFTNKAKRLMEWITTNTQSLKDRSMLDNTLPAAQSAVAAFKQWRVSDKAQHALRSCSAPRLGVCEAAADLYAPAPIDRSSEVKVLITAHHHFAP